MLAMKPSDSPDPSIVPRPASTVLLLRDGARGMEVFTVVRHHKIDFASGALVFPGGSLEADDSVIAANPDLCGPGAPAGEAARAFRIGALRETFEECGVLLARPQGRTELVDAERLEEIHMRAKYLGFADLLAAEKLELALDLLIPFAHWITPTILPKRFDTHFFLAAAPADQLALHDGSESVDSVWINPADALTKSAAGAYTLVFATRLNMEMLARQNDVAAAIAAAQSRKIVTVLPTATRNEDGITLHIPLEAGYGGDTFAMDPAR